MLAVADRALVRPRPRAAAALVAVLAMIAAGVAALWSVRPPQALDADAAPGEFSAARAFEQVQTIASEPHVAGSAANDRVREHLLSTLQSLGLQPEVQDTVSVQGGELSSSAGGIGLARVRNVVTLIPGSAPTGRILLVAHYDSAQSGPGANDDGAGISTVLETARALTTGPVLRNDVVLLLTDAEEACMCGAKAFVDQHPLARDGGVVLNIEARGSSGPAVTFESSPDDAKLIDIFARAPKPVGTSVAVEVYRLLPNDTDFTPFREAGFRGLNTAYIDGAAVYHAPTDLPSAMDQDSLQHQGDNALALIREFGGTDLGTLEARSDATHFPLPGMLARYPGILVVPIAVAALLAVVLLAGIARRRGLVSNRRLIAGFLACVLPIVVAPLLAQVFWTTLTLIRPEYAELSIDPYRPLWYRLAVLAITAAVLFIWYVLLRRRIGPAALAVGGLGWLALIGVALAFFAPGGSYLTAIPALAGALMGMLAIVFRGGAGAVLAVILSGAVAVLVLLPTVVLFFPALGMKLAGAGALFATLLGLALLPIIDLLHPEAGGPLRRYPSLDYPSAELGPDALRARLVAGLPALIAVLAAVAFAGSGLFVDRFDATRPAPTQLMYALDTDSNSARWLSSESTAQAWTSQYVSGSSGPVTDSLPAFGDEKLLSGPATAASLPAPKVTVVSDTRSADGRALRLRLVPQREVRLITLHVSKEAGLTAAAVAGRPVPVDTVAGGPWGFGFVFHAPPAGGIEINLTVRPEGRVLLRAMDASDGLAALPGFQARPADVGIRGDHSSEMVAVARSYTF